MADITVFSHSNPSCEESADIWSKRGWQLQIVCSVSVWYVQRERLKIFSFWTFWNTITWGDGTYDLKSCAASPIQYQAPVWGKEKILQPWTWLVWYAGSALYTWSSEFQFSPLISRANAMIGAVLPQWCLAATALWLAIMQLILCRLVPSKEGREKEKKRN